MKIQNPILLSLCALTLLSGCGKNSDDRSATAAPVVTDNEVNLPGENPQDIQMIRAGMREANEVRRRSRLAPLRFDLNLTIEAQRRARGMGRPGDNFPRNNDQPPGNDFNNFQQPGQSFNGQQFNPGQRFPQQQIYTAENVTFGFRSAEQAFRSFLSNPRYRENLLNRNFHRQGIGYSDGKWVHLLAN